MSDILIEEIDDDFKSKWMNIAMFNAQFTVMRHIVLFKINEEKIEDINEYKNYCESIIAKMNINYFKNWEKLTVTEEAVKIFDKMMWHSFIVEWDFISYHYMMLNKYLKSVLMNAQKHQNESLSTYNQNKMYCWSIVNSVLIKKWIKFSYKKIELFFQNVTVMITQTVNIVKKNAVIIINLNEDTKVKKIENEYLVALQKLNNVVTLKLMKVMKKVIRISKNVMNDD